MKNIEFKEETVENGKFENIEYKNEILENIQFINTSFEKSDFSGTEFSNVEFDEIEAKEVNFEKCKMWSDQLTFKGKFENCNWQGAEINCIENISGIFLKNSFKDSIFENSSFTDVELQGNDFSGATLDSCGITYNKLINNNFCKANIDTSFSCLDEKFNDFTKAILDYSSWYKCICKEDIFRNASANSASFEKTDCTLCDFEKTVMEKCKLKKSKLTDCSFKDTELLDSTFIECTLKNIDFTSIKYKNVTFTDCQFENVTFTEQQKKDFGLE